MTELAVLVPVLNRPQNVGPLVESFLAGCPIDSRLRFLCSFGDEAEKDAVQAAAHDRISWIAIETIDTWPQKINLGVTLESAEWYLCAADDVRFTEGWWDATARLRVDLSVGVIGTNDSWNGTGNPRVAEGTHTCHPLIRASYIRDYGTIDQPGLAVHPAYKHTFVDDELVWTAKQRGAWAYCREAVIEHLHPYWGGVERDATYDLGETTYTHDGALWRQRMPLLGLQPAD